MTAVSVPRVDALSHPDWKLEISEPQQGFTSSVHAVSIRGTLIGDGLTDVEVVLGRRVLRTAPIRPDGRFQVAVGTAGLPRAMTLMVRAVTADGLRRRVARVVVRRRPVRPRYRARLSPLMVVCLPRSGSTLLMGGLAAHPGVVAGLKHPHEMYAAQWWLHQAKVASDPSDFHGSVRPNEIGPDLGRVGNPPHHLPDDPVAWAWMGGEHPAIALAHAMRSIDGFYGRLAADQGKPDARYFAEKRFAGRAPYDLVAEAYPAGRELVLVRDLRDVLASRIAFHEMRTGSAPMLASPVRMAAQMKSLASAAHALAARLDASGDAAHVIRYERLIGDSAAVVSEALLHLDLASEPDTAVVSVPGAPSHITARSVGESVGRWEHDLPEMALEQLDELLGPANAALGYA